ncbi:histidine kinase [Paenibacillus swuensis]|uniref:Histidine kinase n=2 Tax=Paenibacillus swuensis TaxID=1178515 RepID=A0A172TN58_9BACL|nr:HD-GYP domain-containing protein [Paenibacillus swuensis]ANE48460.1 histidine kinase [Paenibacillus swuensis]
MRLIPIHRCEPGMKLGRKIYNEEGLVLLSEQVELTGGLIRRLEQMGIAYIYIADARTEDVTIPDLISDDTRRRVMFEIRSNFKRIMDEAGRKRNVVQPTMGKDFRNVMQVLIDDLGSHKDAMIMLTNMSITDLYLYEHSLNVCIYSTMLGMADGYNREELMTLGLGALLHDVGKTKIPVEILHKPHALSESEFETMKKHAELGFRILKDEPNIPLLSAHCAFQHHERMNGTGYPRGIGGEDIHDYAKWIGLVDSYDAMISHRVYRKAMLPHQAMEMLYTGSGTLYEQSKLEAFRDKVALYPVGVSVMLHSGEKGVVVDINSSFPQRPIIRVLQDAEGQDLKQMYEIDLSKNLNVMIAQVNDQFV